MTHKKKDKNKDNKRRRLLLFLLLLFLLISIFAIFKFTKSNLDDSDQIIDIKPTDKDDTDKNNQSTEEQKPQDNNSNKDNNNPKNPVKEEPEDDKIFSVKDELVKWEQTTELKIFQKEETNLIATGKMAPGMNDTYDFTIRNNNAFSVKVNISFMENNPYNILMKYRLKEDNKYIFNKYIDYEYLIVNDFTMEPKSKKNFTLDWKWFESNVDTQIGIEGKATYSIMISILAEEI